MADLIVTPSWHDDVRMGLGRGDEHVEGRFHELAVLASMSLNFLRRH